MSAPGESSEPIFKLPFSREEYSRVADNFIQFLNKTGSPYHSVQAVIDTFLTPAGFQRLDLDSSTCKVQRGGKYFITKGGSCICAFYVGRHFSLEEGRSVTIASHTDSPCLRVRPHSGKKSERCNLLTTSTYGGGLWHTWFDRGLGYAGKVVVRKDGGMSEMLVESRRPVVIIPNLAIHLNRAEDFVFDKETRFMPVSSTDVGIQLNTNKKTTDSSTAVSVMNCDLLNDLITKVNFEEILDVDICLMDATPANRCGFHNEFIESGRLDNQGSVFTSFSALMHLGQRACPISNPSVQSCLNNWNSCDDTDIYIAVAFDHEEVGSASSTGADSLMYMSWLETIVRSLTEDYARASVFQLQWPSFKERSFFVSSDMAHAVHPNYADYYQNEHKPRMNHGVVIKQNVNQRYSTTCSSAATTRLVAESVGCPIQDFIVKNSAPCGSTIGPLSSKYHNMLSVDIGQPQWAMHSIRETCGTADIAHGLALCYGFYTSVKSILVNTNTLDHPQD